MIKYIHCIRKEHCLTWIAYPPQSLAIGQIVRCYICQLWSLSCLSLVINHIVTTAGKLILMQFIQISIKVWPLVDIFNGAWNHVWGSSFMTDYENPLHLGVVDWSLRWMGIKRFQTSFRRVWNCFIPHESQVSIYHNQGVVDSLFCSPINTNKVAFYG